MRFLALLFLLLPGLVAAETIVPIRTIRAKEIISAEDLVLKPVNVDGTYNNAADVVGQEARVALYAGRPVRYGDVGPPAIVARNEIVSLIYTKGGLRIVTEGRSLGRGAVGDTIRAMNIASRSTVAGKILADGSIEVY